MSLNWTLKALRVLIKLSFSALFLCLSSTLLLHSRKQTHKITPFLLAFGYAILSAWGGVLLPFLSIKENLLRSQDLDQKPLLRSFSRYLEK